MKSGGVKAHYQAGDVAVCVIVHSKQVLYQEDCYTAMLCVSCAYLPPEVLMPGEGTGLEEFGGK